MSAKKILASFLILVLLVAFVQAADIDFDTIEDSEDNCKFLNNLPAFDSDNDGIGDACAPQFLGTVSLNCNGVAREVGYSPNLIGNGVDYRPDCTPLPIPAP